jgi:GMP synthase-like glutamine amidotransferase
VNVLAVVHGEDGPPGSFGEVVTERRHRLDTWSIASEPAPPRPVEEYRAVMLLGGAMHADEELRHPWLADERVLIERLLDAGTPLLGVCLGAQLLAQAAGATVAPATRPEIGWIEVELTAEAADDPVLGDLPPRFPAFQWHFYAFAVPAGGVELGRSAVCPQAFRLGESAWGVQFHPEVTGEIVANWIAESPEEVPGTPEALLAETDRRIAGWVGLGGALCGGFVEVAERVGAAA